MHGGPRPYKTGSERAPALRRGGAVAPTSSLVGRDREVSELLELVRRSPVVTLTGPPGVGKSRLAMEVASRLQAREAAPVVLVAMDELPGPAQVAPAVAAALAELDHRGPGGHGVVILDDCDRVVAACAQAAARLLRQGIRVLATAREALGAEGEVVRRVPPLSLPEPGRHGLPEVFIESDAVQLFCDRAAAAVRGFIPTPADADAIAAICERLNGIPLALELAARSLTAHSATDVAARLDDPFPLLTARIRTGHPRHRSMWASLAWTYDALAGSERMVLDRLSVFPGSFTLDAASAVCGEDAMTEAELSEIVRGLVDKSLLEVEVEGGRARYLLLHIIRAFAKEKLNVTGEADYVRVRHAGWCKEVVEGAGDFRRGGPWRTLVSPYHDDIHAALHWAIDNDQGQEAVILAEADLRLCRADGRPAEGRHRMAQATTLAGAAPPSLRARAHTAAGMAAAAAGDLAGAVAHIENSLSAAEEAGEPIATARARLWLAFLGVLTGGQPRPVAALDAAMTAARGTGDRALTIEALAVSGDAHWLVGNPARAHDDFAECLEAARVEGDEVGQATGLVGMGGAAVTLGHYADGDAALLDGLERARALGEPATAAMALVWLGESARLRGELDAARTWFAEAADVARAADHPRPLAQALLGLGRVAASHGDAAAARARFQGALATARAGSVAHLVAACLCGLAEVCTDPFRARSLVGQALTAAQACGDRAGEALGFEHLARLSRELGHVRGATSRHRQALLMRARIGDPAAIACSLEAMAGLAAGRGGHAIAARLVGAAEALRHQHGCVRPPSPMDEHASVVESIRHALGQEIFEDARREGAAMPLKGAIAYAARHGGKRVARASTGWEALTGAERNVANLVARGRTNAQVARELGIADTTVKAHLRNVYAKLGVQNRTALVVAHGPAMDEGPRSHAPSDEG